MTTKRAKALKPVIMMYGYPGSGLTIGIPHLCIPLTPASKRKVVEVMAKAHCEAISGEPIPDWYFRITKNRFKKVLAALEAMASPTE